MAQIVAQGGNSVTAIIQANNQSSQIVVEGVVQSSATTIQAVVRSVEPTIIRVEAPYVGPQGIQGAPGLVQTVSAGSGISVDSTDPANPVISNTQTSAEWGNINGTIGDQTDLINYIAAQLAALVDSSPGTLDTLNELAAALGDDPNFATTITNALATKAPLASPSFTGNITLSDAGATVDGLDLSGAAKGTVNHGATAGTARPAGYASVEWRGSVEPTNAIDGDTWVNTA